MKNQYFGDINDYRKYGMLRLFAGQAAFKVGVCWMLTASDNRTDGRFIQYLDNSQVHRWAHYDTPLYQALQAKVLGEQVRDVVHAETLIAGAQFHRATLTDNARERLTYFDAMYQHFVDVDLVFFDPDNGLEVQSVRYGKPGSAKYLYLEEIRKTFQRGTSLLIYQHFARVERSAFIAEKAMQLRACTGADNIYALRTSNTVFFCVIQAQSRNQTNMALQQIQERWSGQIEVARCL